MRIPPWLKIQCAVFKRPGGAGALVVVLGFIMVARIASLYPEFTATADEGNYLASGIELYQKHTAVLNPQQPPLSRWAIGLAPYLSGLRITSEGSVFTLGEQLLESGEDYWRTLTLARAGNLVFVPLLLYCAFRWARELYGKAAGLVSVLLLSFSPTVIGHAGVATADLAVTATFLMTAWLAWRWVVDPSRRNALWIGVGLGLALASKYSAIGFLAPLFAMYWVLGFARAPIGQSDSRAADSRSILTQGLLAGGVAFLVLWATYCFDMTPLRDPSRMPQIQLADYLSAESRLGKLAEFVTLRVPLPMQSYFGGIVLVLRHALGGHAAFQNYYGQFLFGEVKWDGGWWYYFPVALAVKLTLPLLGLCLLAAWALRKSSRTFRRDGSTFVVAGIVSVVGVAMLGTLNIGVRHVLPAFPFMAILSSSLFRRLDGQFVHQLALRAVASVLLGGHLTASVLAHPDYLAYFNEGARGRETHILGDSNLDWGQDLGRLAEYIEQHHIEEISLSYFGPTSPEIVGISNYRVLNPNDRPTGWVAASVLHVQGIFRHPNGGDFTWLAREKPVARIGKSILLYKF